MAMFHTNKLGTMLFKVFLLAAAICSAMAAPSRPLRSLEAISVDSRTNQISIFHGYVSHPPSRASLCQLRVNRDCGRIIYEPQSIEGPKGFPNSPRSPPDGKIANGNNARFEKLNEYGENRWSLVEFPKVSCHNQTHVQFNLVWKLTAPHRTDSIRVFVSNENYSMAKPLSRSQLDLTPICTVMFHGEAPPRNLMLTCTMSKEKLLQLKRQKELLMLSVWDIDDTENAFYQVMDLLPIPEDVTFESVQSTC